ncbi:MAG TPA: MFS transporter [Blastocatellia bacterium]|nr:MFS transporter [Blastocatellia bacterium]
MNKRPIPHLRWYIAVLLCLSSELNYLDRQTLSVLANTIQKELNFTDVQYASITSVFLYSYSVMYLVSGRIVDNIGTRRGFQIFVSAWSVANMMHALARTVGQFSFFRLLLGAAEPANFPAGVRAVSEWFPMRERALAVGIFNAGTALGNAVAAPLVSLIAINFGWRYAFIITGSLGFIWVLAWSFSYHLPQHHPRISEKEKQMILADHQTAPQSGEAPAPLGRLIRMPETWGCVMARVLTDPISYFFSFWIPKYFQQERGFTLGQVGMYVWIPFAALTLGNLFSGAMPRFLISLGWPLNRARKATMLGISLLMPVCWLMVTRVGSPAVAVVFVTVIMFGHAAWGNVILPAEVFPKTAIGTVTGLGGCLGALTGAVTQYYIGQVVQNISFAPLFIAGAGMYLLAFLLVHLLIGELGRIREV